MQRVPLSFLFLISCNVFGAAKDTPFDTQAHLEKIVRENDTLGNKEFFGPFIKYGDYPSEDNPLYEPFVAAAKERAEVSRRNRYSEILHFAAAGKSHELVVLFAEAGLSFKKKNSCGQIPLHGAVHSSLETLEFVLKHTPNNLINLKDRCDTHETRLRSTWAKEDFYKGRAPLHYLSRIIVGGRQKSDKVEYISADVACAKIRLFSEYGAGMNVQDGFWGRTVLHWSVFHPIQVMETLLELKADPNIKDLQGRTVLDVLNMTLRKTPGLVDGDEKQKLLLEYGAIEEYRRADLKSSGKWVRKAHVEDVRPIMPQPRAPEWRNRSRQQHASRSRSGYVAPRLSRADTSENWRKK